MRDCKVCSLIRDQCLEEHGYVATNEEHEICDLITHQIATAPPTPNCVFCEQQHRFEHCPVVNDHEFLKSFVIKTRAQQQKLLRDTLKKHCDKDSKLNSLAKCRDSTKRVS